MTTAGQTVNSWEAPVWTDKVSRDNTLYVNRGLPIGVGVNNPGERSLGIADHERMLLVRIAEHRPPEDRGEEILRNLSRRHGRLKSCYPFITIIPGRALQPPPARSRPPLALLAPPWAFLRDVTAAAARSKAKTGFHEALVFPGA